MQITKLECYQTREAGYHPLLVRTGWQVAQLNDREDLHAANLAEIERHQVSDEVFVLVRGCATLIEATVSETVNFVCTEMKQGVIYNIPQGVWHAIRTSPDMQVLIVERDGTHLRDVERRRLTVEEQARLRKHCWLRMWFEKENYNDRT